VNPSFPSLLREHLGVTSLLSLTLARWVHLRPVLLRQAKHAHRIQHNSSGFGTILDITGWH
jgi:hypothetical protein